MFSVVIPLYNKSAYINKAIVSVLNQTFQEFELIIVNDGSTDDSLEIVQKYNDPRIQIINQVNSGVSTARNNGVKAARYDYIAFLDADDWWDKNFLKEMKMLITELNDAAIYASNYFTVKNRTNTKAIIGVDENFTQGYINYFKVYSTTFWVPVNCSFVVVKKTMFIQENGFNKQLKFGEDFDLWLRISLKYKVAYLNKYLAYSNQDVATNNRALGNKLWRKEEHVIFNLQYVQKEEESNIELKKLLDGLRVRSLVYYFIQNKYRQEVDEIISGIDFSLHPKFYRFIYTYPRWVIKLFFFAKQKGSVIKQELINTFKI